MAKDVVCAMVVDEHRAAKKSAYEGRPYYFCSADCHQRFETDPARYSETGKVPSDAAWQHA